MAAAATLLVVGSLAHVTSAAAAEGPYELYMGLGGDCIGVNAAPHSKGRFIVRSAAGRVRASLRYNTGEDGQHVLCPSIDGIHGGDRLTIRADDGWLGRWLVPRIRVRIDRGRDLLTGSTDPGRSLAVELWDVGPFGRGVKPVDDLLVPRIDDDGTFQLDVSSSVDLQGHDAAFVHTDRRGLHVTAVVGVPFLVIDVRSGSVIGAGPVASRISVTLVRAGVVHGVARASSEPTGSFYAVLRDLAGDPVRPQPGDRILLSAPAVPVVRVPTIRVHADAASDTVRGRCMSDVRYELDFDGGLAVRGRTGPDGRLRRDVSRAVNLRPGDALSLTCRYPQGDMIHTLGHAA